MPVRMTHPKHGVTHAVGSEVAWNKAHGWKVDEAEMPQEASSEVLIVPGEAVAEVEIVENPEDDIDVLRSAWEAKFGKPADRRKGAATLRAELKE